MPILDRLTTPVVKAEVLANASQTGDEQTSAVALQDVVAIDFTAIVTAWTSGALSMTIEVSATGSGGWTTLDSKYYINNGATLSAVGVLSIGISGLENVNQKFARAVLSSTLVLDASVIALTQLTDR